jgi:hypothetical protein
LLVDRHKSNSCNQLDDIGEFNVVYNSETCEKLVVQIHDAQASKKPPSQHLSSAILLLAVQLLHMCPPGICPQHKYITTFLGHVYHATFRKRKGKKKKTIGGFS